jgi:hypothetical protein
MGKCRGYRAKLCFPSLQLHPPHIIFSAAALSDADTVAYSCWRIADQAARSAASLQALEMLLAGHNTPPHSWRFQHTQAPAAGTLEGTCCQGRR